jgi:hypothetical protein
MGHRLVGSAIMGDSARVLRRERLAPRYVASAAADEGGVRPPTIESNAKKSESPRNEGSRASPADATEK